ncbi:uncharacterized protein LOC9652520 [Selaginella moellendorffii]|uniref:uncharacterized protein LOC9652520 n=1 Tax=Selaginella moellendorffii TaxID=88036 RepID=UPI000D1CCF4D|nr:uncharacterized protein LOC9652520 [Selaginella moellendorffii]|eukprot:XP_024527313.1 uncharacterized protein LOC9652520 [Selaginella moellendorffii]
MVVPPRPIDQSNPALQSCCADGVAFQQRSRCALARRGGIAGELVRVSRAFCLISLRSSLEAVAAASAMLWITRRTDRSTCLGSLRCDPRPGDGEPQLLFLVSSFLTEAKETIFLFLFQGTECCERLAFYGINANLVMYLTKELHQGNATAAKNVAVWAGTGYLTPLIGAFIADSFLGRFKTIAAFSTLYVVGLVLLTLSSSLPSLTPPDCPPDVHKCPKASLGQLSVFYTALYLVALGMGGIKPCVSAFGADQFDDEHKSEKKKKSHFFNWFYLSINLGALIASTVLAQEARWQRAHQSCTGFGRGVPQVDGRSPLRRNLSIWLPRQELCHRRKQEDRAHGRIQISRQGCHCDYSRSNAGAASKPVELMHRVGGGGREASREHHADLGQQHLLLDRLRADVQPLRGARHENGAAPRPGLLRPASVHVPLRGGDGAPHGSTLRPRHREAREEILGTPPRLHSPPAHGNRPLPLHLPDGVGLFSGEEALGDGRDAGDGRRRSEPGSNDHLLASAAVLAHRDGRDFHVRRAARVLLRAGTGLHEELGDRPGAHDLRTGILHQQPDDLGGDQDHAQRLQPRVDFKQLESWSLGLLLRDHGRDSGGERAVVCALRERLQVQGDERD